MSSTAKVRLEGWLIKRKSKDRPSLFKNENLRWFRIQEVEGSDQVELALCYYHSRKDKEAKGWIYLRDISQILDDKKAFTVVSAARTMTLEAQSHAEHILWIQTLANCSPFVGGNKDASRHDAAQSKQSNENSLDAKEAKPLENKEEAGSSFVPLSHDRLKSLPPTDQKNSTIGDRSLSLFSRHGNGDKNSFYTQASNLGSSLHTISDDYGEDDHDNYGIETNVDLNTEHSKPRSSSNPRSGPKDDHRLQGFRAGDTNGTVSGRLNKYINKEGNGKLPRPESQGEIEDVALEEPHKLRSRDLRAQHRSRQQEARRRSDSDSSFPNSGIAIENNLAVSDESDSDYDGRNDGKSADDSDRSSEKQKREAPSVAVTAPSNPPMKAGMAPPTSAPPRRAKDALAEAENQKSRRSIDEILFKKENRAEAKTSDVDSSDDENVDLKAEYRKYSNTDTEGGNLSKPPRPINAKSNMPTGAPSTAVNRNKSGGYRMGTPPRPSADPGSQVDQNFVSDDWDDNEDENLSRHNYSHNDRNNGSDKRPPATSGVGADPNWLDENFDD